MNEEEILVKEQENLDEVSWYRYPLLQHLFFLQPLESILRYNRRDNHKTCMKAPKVDYSILPPLQKSGYEPFNDGLELKIDQLQMYYTKYGKQYSLMTIMFLNNWSTIVHYTATIQICSVIKMLVSYFLAQTLSYVSLYTKSKASMDELLIHISILAGLLFVQVITEHHYFQDIYQVSVRLRYQVVGLLYRKLLKNTQVKFKDQLFNLISMDLNEIDSGLTWFLALSGSVIVGIVGCLILINFFSLWGLLGLLTLFLTNFVSRTLVASTGSIKTEKNKFQDKRTKLTSELLHNMRSLKMFASEWIYRDKIVRLRDQQDKQTLKLLNIDAIAQSLTGNLSVFISLMVIIVPYAYSGGKLSVDKVFGSMWVLSLFKVWCLTYYYRGIKFWVNMKLVQQRVQEILELQDRDSRASQSQKPMVNRTKGQNIAMFDEEGPTEQQPENETEKKVIDTKSSDQVEIYFQQYNASWKSDDYNLIKDLNFQTSGCEGKIIAVIGKVGSGKSSFLQAILGEITNSTGVRRVHGSIAFVEQNPYIFSGTIYDNILFGSMHDTNLYQKAIQLSCLDKDLQSKGDQYQVGDKGQRLSGGQKARLSFARAIYSQANIILLDDVLSAVDTRVGRSMFQQGIQSLKDQGKLVILVTHQLQWAAQSDQILLFENGQITKQAEGSTAIQNLLKEVSGGQEYFTQEQETKIQEIEQPPQLEEELATAVDIPTQVYHRYIVEAGGYRTLIVIAILYLGDASLNMTMNKFFGSWGILDEADYTDVFYDALRFLVLYALVNFSKLVILFRQTIAAIQNMHRKLCTSIVRSQMIDFESVPTGSILARFTNDLNNIEGMVMLDSHWALEGCTDNLFVVIVVAIQNIYILAVATGFLTFIFVLKTLVSKSMKFAVKCDDITRGELFNFIESSIQGVTLIRTYKQEDYFIKRFQELVYKNMQSYFFFLRVNALIAFLFDFSMTLIVISSLFILILTDVGHGKIDADDLGFSIIMLMNLGYMFSLNVRGQIYLDIDMQNALRVFRSIDTPSEGEYEYDNDFQIQLNNWPQTGNIVFKNVTVNYRQTMMGINQRFYALKNICLSLKGGESVGVVGRTGAGKSSLLNALLRMVDLESGSILVDDIDIDTIGIHTLREKLLVIPQQAPIMGVSIRENIDPKNQANDAAIWNAIDRVGLTKIGNLPQKLDTIADDSMFSAGEKQLLCFCRVLLCAKPKILLFDEATSNIDEQTDKMVTNLIKTQFPRVTKIIIAHRLQTVVSCDRILVMDQGEIAQFDQPKVLYKSQGIFRQMFEVLDESTKAQIQNEFDK